MQIVRLTFIFFIVCATTASCITSPMTPLGTFTEFTRTYSPDSSKFLLSYDYVQGAWDGGRSSSVAILNSTDSVKSENIKYYYSTYDFDKIYWKGNDTVLIEDKYTAFISQGKSPLKDTVLNGVTIKIIRKDPIDTSFTQKIFYRDTSPNGKYELIVYKYVKPVNGNYFLNISVINKGDAIPRFGNFYISRWDFDCFNDIRWDSKNVLDCKVSSSCYYSFTDYLVKSRPNIKYNVKINDTIHGNIQGYMQ
ncbi:MAG: hypothetical protein ABI402_07055 [Ferruginibacter sp.]